MVDNRFTDLVPPFVAGYDTPFWFTDKRLPSVSTLDQITAFGGVAASCDIGLGIKGVIFENGMVLFDFSTCEKTPVVIHRESLYETVVPSEKGFRETPDSISVLLRRSEQKQSQNQAFYRSIAVAHTLLLENSARIVGKTSLSLPYIEDTSDLVLGYTLDKMMAHCSAKSSVALSPMVAEHSLSTLKDALATGLHVVQSLELHKVSHYRFVKKSFAECLVMSWTLCENMIEFIWEGMLEDIKNSSPSRMTKARRNRLKGFTASNRIETLELAGRLNQGQAEDLNFVRKARNDWLHTMTEVTEQDALHSIEVCQNLISSLYSIPVQTTIGGVGGSGGGMRIDRFRAQYGAEKLKDAYDGS